MTIDTPCTRLAAALHAACVELDVIRRHPMHRLTTVAGAALAAETKELPQPWLDSVGRHVALAIAAMPDSVLREWLLAPRVVGGVEIYQTIKTAAGVRAGGKAAAA